MLNTALQMGDFEKYYTVSGDREHRAIGGFSMGGRQILTIGLSNTYLFYEILDRIHRLKPVPIGFG